MRTVYDTGAHCDYLYTVMTQNIQYDNGSLPESKSFYIKRTFLSKKWAIIETYNFIDLWDTDKLYVSAIYCKPANKVEWRGHVPSKIQTLYDMYRYAKVLRGSGP
jgi:hypothetical protein